MIGIDWLRAKARQQRKPATGGVVRITDAPPLVTPTGYLIPVAKTAPAEVMLTFDNRNSAYTPPREPVFVMPTFAVEVEATLTEAEVEQIRQQLQIVPRVKPAWGEPLECTCVAIYSECRCPDTNISAQTNSADFPGDQQQSTI